MTVKVNDVFTVNDDNFKCTPIIFNYTKISGIAKPTLVVNGSFSGFSLPVYNSDDEELFGAECLPLDWDGISNLQFLVDGWLDTENTSKRLNLELALGVGTEGEALPSPEIETREGVISGVVESFHTITFSFDAGAVGFLPGQSISVRLRRLAASQDELLGEYVVRGLFIKYKLNKAGSAS